MTANTNQIKIKNPFGQVRLWKKVQLTVGERLAADRAASISVEEHMCWSDFLNILRFPLNAEFTSINK